MRTFFLMLGLLCLCLLAVGQSNPPLINDVIYGDLEQVRMTLDHRALNGRWAEVNEWRAADEMTAVMIALENNNLPVARLLIGRGANLYRRTKAGTPLEVCGNPATQSWFQGYMTAAASLKKAMFANDTAAITAISRQGYPVDLADSLGVRPLTTAVKVGNVDLVKHLLALGAQPAMVNLHFDEYLLLIDAAQHGRTKIMQLLLDHGCDPKQEDGYGNAALNFAIAKGHTEAAKLLIEKGADLNAKGLFLDFPLYLAAQYHDKVIMDLLLAKGATVKNTEEGEERMLAIASNFGDKAYFLRIVDALDLDLNLPYSPYAYRGHNPVLAAVTHDSLDFVRYLVEDLHYAAAGSPGFDSPLKLAVEAGQVQVVKYLLGKLQGNPQLEYDLLAGLENAIKNCDMEMVDCLVEYGHLESFYLTGAKALQSACDQNCLPAAKRLLKAGVENLGIEKPDGNPATYLYLQKRK